VDKDTLGASYLANPSKGVVRHWNRQFVQHFQDWESLWQIFLSCSMKTFPRIMVEIELVEANKEWDI
jgi:hypothetical protein